MFNLNQFYEMDKTLTFIDRQAFREWLGKYGTESTGVWLLFSKKGNLITLSANDALEEALCHVGSMVKFSQSMSTPTKSISRNVCLKAFGPSKTKSWHKHFSKRA